MVRSGTVYVKVQQSKDVGMCNNCVCVFLVCTKLCLCALYAVFDSHDALIEIVLKWGQIVFTVYISNLSFPSSALLFQPFPRAFV